MARREIVFTRTSAKQRRAILEYWTKRNGSTKYARKLIRISNEHLKVISDFPESFRETELSGIHESAMGHFSIYYRFTESTIIVMAFWDNRQDPAKLLDAIK